MMRNVFLMPALMCLSALLLSSPPFARGDEEEAQQLAQKAQELLREKNYEKAIEAIHKAIKMAPGNDHYLMIASQSEWRAGRFAEGVKDALAAIKINDKVGLYYALVAANAYGNEEPELALEYCRKVIAMGPSKAGQSIYNDAKAYEDMLLKKTYTITWNLDPSKRQSAGNSITVALPKGDLPYQTVTVQVKGAKSHRIIKGQANDVLRVVPDGDKTFQVITKVTVVPVSHKAKLAKAGSGSVPVNVRAYLGAADGFNPASPALKKIATEVKGKNSVETVKNILTWLHKNIKYKEVTTNITKQDFKNVDEIVERGHAECRGYTMLFTALCRAAGVPARPVWGIMFYANPKSFSSHNWDEVYITGVGWVPVDPQKVETFGWLPIDHVRVFMDLRKSSTSEENLPLMNLMYMNGNKLEYEQSR
jgi:tetratricopeptide (TPR) repeat protein